MVEYFNLEFNHGTTKVFSNDENRVLLFRIDDDDKK